MNEEMNDSMSRYEERYSGSDDRKGILDWKEDGLEEEWISEDGEEEEVDREVETETEPARNTTKIEKVSVVKTPEWKRAYRGNGTPSNNGLQNLFHPPREDDRRDGLDLSDIPEGSEGSKNDDSVDDMRPNVKKTVRNESGSLGFRFFEKKEKSNENEENEDNEGEDSENNESQDMSKVDQSAQSVIITQNQNSPNSTLNSTASSPLKVFQKSNTYTKGKLEHLLGSLDNKDETTSSRYITNTLDSLRNGSDDRPKLTDYITEADALMNDLRSKRPIVAEFSNSTSMVSDSTNDSDYSNSLNELEYSLKQHSPEMNDSLSSSSLSSNVKADYYNSVKGRVENGSTFIKKTNNNNSSSSSYSSISLNEYPADDSNEHSETSTKVSDADSSIPSQTQLGSPNKKHPAMAVITPSDLKNYSVDGMIWDEANHCWKKTPNEYGTGTTKVETSFDDKDPDPFEGIDDLDDSSKMEENWQLSEVTPEQVAATASALQGLEEIPEQPEEEEIEEIGEVEEIQEIQPVHSPDSSETSTKSLILHDTVKNDSNASNTPESPKITLTSTTYSVKREVSVQLSKKSIPKYLLKNPTFSPLDSAGPTTPITPRVNATGISRINSSFSDVYTTIIKILTDEYPNSEWTKITELSLSNYKLSTLRGLDNLCPNLEILNASNNQLGVIGGIPPSVLCLDISNNPLTNIISFKTLLNLQQLNLAHNRLDSLISLSGLVHLTDINLDNNSLRSLHGIENIRGLRSLSVRNNNLTLVDFSKCKWTKLEELYLSDNRIELVKGLDKLTNLINIDLDNNHVVSFSTTSSTRPYNSIRKLTLNGNNTTIDVSMFKQLRELQFDGNKRVTGLERLHHLDALTFRDQTEKTHLHTWESLCDIRRLHLSNNGLRQFNIGEPFLNLQLLELSGASLTALPPSFSEFCLNLRELDLSFNQISDLSPLIGIPKLKRLYLYQNRITNIYGLTNCVSSMPYLQVLDTRANPITDALYPLLQADDQQSYRKTHTRQKQQKWLQKSAHFTKNHLTESTRKLRTVYRGTLLGSSQKGIKWLDGALITEDEMIEALDIVRANT